MIALLPELSSCIKTHNQLKQLTEYKYSTSIFLSQLRQLSRNILQLSFCFYNLVVSSIFPIRIFPTVNARN